MSDPLDEAERYTNLLIQEGMSKKQPVPEKTGECLECGEPTPGAFCSRECREDYEKTARLKAIAGKK
jgi:hypothetical protein